jgi:ring-1,2-phenylacetyl-CoA epoxidase subunit PaaD
MVTAPVAVRGAPAIACEPARIARWLQAVRDPEVPVLSVMDLGIVRDIGWEGDACVVTVTPTYSGCPAMREISMDIERVLHAHGVPRVVVRTRLAPAWTTDWLSETGRRALQAYGIAAPVERAVDVSGIARRAGPRVPCPRCGSDDTRMLSGSGSTACKALYRCNACREPFDYFKAH